MDDSNSSAFSFGSAQDTYVMNVKDNDIVVGKLPYNPFLFDISLVLINSPEGYEEKGKFIELNNGCVNVFGRKAKAKKSQENNVLTQKRYDFLAETMSRRHFSINQASILKDQGSKMGTFLWIHRNTPKLIQIGDEFLLNNLTLKINDINTQTQKIQIQLQTTIITFTPKKLKDRIFLIGSSPKCHYIRQELKNFHIAFDLFNLTLCNLIEDQDCDLKVGTWLKVKEPIKIQGGDLIMAGPYIMGVKW